MPRDHLYEPPCPQRGIRYTTNPRKHHRPPCGIRLRSHGYAVRHAASRKGKHPLRFMSSPMPSSLTRCAKTCLESKKREGS